MNQPTVSVIIITYNQDQYIVQCIESVLAQKVHFSYEILIGDDMSTDNTHTICQDYASRFDFIHVCPRTENLGVAGNWADCTSKAKGKYIMMLDGDDYWQNPDKMQMQTDFMDAHPECVLCHTDVDVLRMKTGRLTKNSKEKKKLYPPEGWILHDVIAGNDKITSSSICMRGDIVRNHIPFELYVKEEFPCEDWPTIVIMSAYGEVRYIPISTATYRTGIQSVTNQRDYEKIKTYKLRSKHMTECLYKLFPNELGEFRDGWWFDTSVYEVLLRAAYENHDFHSAKEFAAKCSNMNVAKRMAANKITFWIYEIFRRFK